MKKNKEKNMKKFKFLVALLIVAIGSGGIRLPVYAKAATAVSVVMDTYYLEEAIVSSTPVELKARVLDNEGNYVYGETVNFSVIRGADVAEIREGNLLYVLKAGEFTVRAALAGDDSILRDHDCTAYSVSFGDVRILSKIENITVYSQPVELIGTCSVDGMVSPGDSVTEVLFEVTEGPAEIYSSKYLRFTGAGKVMLKAYSRYDKTVFKTLEINVTDPDAGLDRKEDQKLKQGELETADGGCSSAITGAFSFSIAMSLAFYKVKKKDKRRCRN